MTTPPDRKDVRTRSIETRRVHGDNAREHAASLAAQALTDGRPDEHRLWKHVEAALAVDRLEVGRKAYELEVHGLNAHRYAARLALAAFAEGQIDEYEFWKSVQAALTPRGGLVEEASSPSLDPALP